MASNFDVLHGLLERLLFELELMRPLLPTYIHLIISAIFPIFTAAHASLVRPSSAASAEKKASAATEEDNDDDETEVEEVSPKIETLTPSDALLFPVMAGCTLAGLYFVLKFFQDPAWLNWFLGLYFACIGFFFMVRFLKDGFSVVRSALLPRHYSFRGQLWVANNTQNRFTTRDASGLESHEVSPLPGPLRNFPLPSKVNNVIWSLRRLVYAKARLEVSVYNVINLKGSVEILDLVTLGLTSLVIGYHTFIDKPWYLTNILGFSFCYGSLQFMTPGTSWTGTLLLSALFFYDIYFVFFTPMMVTVATKLDVPIKLLFPRPDGCILPVGAEDGSKAMEEYLKCVAKKRTMAMLGLGDIVIPGMMLAFALRFDLYLFYLRKAKKQPNPESLEKENPKEQKPTYSPATGAWGERFWVAANFHSQLFSGKRFPKPYFYATVAGYIVGMLTTVLVMQIANHAQPALLYLVPGVLVSLWGTALIKGDVKTLWNYSEVPADEKKDNETSKSDGDKTTGVIAAEQSDDTARNSEKKKTLAGPDKKEADKLASNRYLVYFAIILPEKKSRSAAPIAGRIEDSSKPEATLAA